MTNSIGFVMLVDFHCGILFWKHELVGPDLSMSFGIGRGRQGTLQRVQSGSLGFVCSFDGSIPLLVLRELTTLYKASDNLKMPILNHWDLVGVFVVAGALSRVES